MTLTRRTPLKAKTALKSKAPLRAKKTMPKKSKPKARGWYSKKLDDIAKGFAKARDGYVCQKSGEHLEGSKAHGSHVIPVSAGLALRWDLNNIKCLSYHNHLNWWHKNPLEAAEWFRGKFPGRWEYLQERKGSLAKISNADLIEFYQMATQCKNWQEYQAVYGETIGAHI
jgi:hypothetical protein